MVSVKQMRLFGVTASYFERLLITGKIANVALPYTNLPPTRHQILTNGLLFNYKNRDF